MLDDIVERLKQGKLLERDYQALVEALNTGEVVASGVGAIAGGSIVNSHLTTFVLQFGNGAAIEIPEAILAKLSEAVRVSLPPVLHNLPSVAAAFTGRGREEDEIVAVLAGQGGSATISALKGIGGAGKTALAVKVGHRLTVQFPNAQLLIDLRGTSDGPMEPKAAMESVIRRFHPSGRLPDDDAAILEIYRDLLRQKKVLLILDNARDTAQVGRLLPPAPSAAIVTSRQVLHLADAKSIRLDDLPLPDATTFVLKLLDGERSLTDAELRRLAQDCCFCHPLSLRVAALFLKNHQGRGISDYIACVEKDYSRLKLRGLPYHDVLGLIGRSVAQLWAEDETFCADWRDLSVFPSGFDAAAAAAVWTIDDKNAGSDRLCELEAWGLLEPIAHDRYRLHDLLRDVARRDWPAERAEAASRRHAQYFVSVLTRAEALYLLGGAAIGVGLSLFDQERVNIEAGQHWAAAGAARSVAAARLAAAYANAGVNALSLRLHPRERIRWGEAALEGCRRTGDRYGESNALGNLGNANYDLGETRKAIEHYEQVLTIAREIGDRRGAGNVFLNLARVYADLGENRKAMGHYEQALAISREIGNRKLEGIVLGNLGLVYTNLNEIQKAIEHFEQSLTIAREFGNLHVESNGLNNLGLVYVKLGETRKAINCHEKSLAMAREIGDRRREGEAMDHLGLAYAKLGETRKAIDHHEIGLRVAREIGDRRGEAATLLNIGHGYAALGETRRAIEHWEQSLVIAREIGHRDGQAGALSNLGVAYDALGEGRKGMEYYQQCLAIVGYEEP
ncbi:tetratricopeptide repeat protein [Bradyrhizobium sp. 197]|uniref:tetratricopeptide repeat protein n=1 Tax=Bradyrhizobium sp. 197 TaxID=2782663 RepID=UPI001FFAF544|nr:tetratricopeptide repeat protein [Bradyrhizobium sp. 197]MCK1480744.1 tetratricopeptide repeat protein [Bradyrhizobium sp. 197]